MKRFTTILMLLMTVCMGAWADGLKVSTTESASAEYQYKIFCRNASTYYLGNTTNATNSGADYGLFAFFADDSGDYTNGYYIYSIFEGKWVTYTAKDSYAQGDEGKNKITLTTEKPTVPWHIAADNSDNKYYDIRAFKTDKTLDDSGYASWNWHGGVANNASNTMGFYRYTDNNSGWGIVLAGGSGSPVADRKVVALYNVPNDNIQYALYNNNGTPKVYNSTTGVTPQYFVLRQNGLDTNGEALYRLQKAEIDGKYLKYQEFNTEGFNYMFLNTTSSFNSSFTLGSGATQAVSPYYNLYRVYPNATDNNSRPYANQVSQCNNAVVNMYSGSSDNLPAQLTDKGSWNGRWQVVEQTYTAWQVIITGAAGGSITYKGTSLLTGATATQSNNGMFVINSASTPTSSDFTINNVNGYLTDPSISFDTNRKLIKVTYTEYATIYNTITNFLSNTPETIGYPNSSARSALQNAIDAFDASSKVTSNLASLNTAYVTFQSTTDINIPEVGKVYTIQTYVETTPDATSCYLQNVNGTFTMSSTKAENALQNLWIARANGDYIVFQSAYDFTKYLTYESTGIAASGTPWDLSAERRKGTKWPYISLWNKDMAGSNDGRYLGSNGSSELGKFGTNSTNYWGSNKTQGTSWSTDFKFVESDEYKIITYKLMWNGSQIDSQEALVEIGAAPSSPWSKPDFCDDYTFNVNVIAANTAEVEVRLNWDGPFTISSDFNSATWYYMMNNNTHYLYYSSEGDNGYKVLITDDNPSGAGKNAMWAFVGNPYDGIRVINLGAGNGKYLNLSTKPDMVEASYPTYSLCDIIEGTGYFKLKNGAYYLVNHNNDYISIQDQEAWYNTTWAQYQVSAVDWAEFTKAVIDDYASTHALGSYFGVDPLLVTATKTAIDEHSSVFNKSMYESVTADFSGLTKYPETGYYRIKNNGTGDYIGYGQPAAAYNDKTAGLIAISSDNVATDASSIIRLTGSEGTYKLSTEGLNVQSQTTGSQAFPATSSTGVDFVFTSSNNDGIVSITNAASRVDDDKDGSMHNATGWTVNGIVNWSASADNSKWVVEDATSLTVNLSNVDGMYYATFCAPFSYTVSEGTTAYTLSQSGEWLIPTAVVGEVPAGTPVLLKGTVSSATLTIGSGYAATPLTTTSISGTYTTMDFALSGTPAATAEYFLGKKNGVLGFYHSGIASKEGFYTLGANKAYLSSSAGARGFAIMWDENETTGVNEVIGKMSEVTDGAIYDLQGRKVANPSRGMYIINGRKIVIK